jgi:three-Cys-motif partner protein
MAESGLQLFGGDWTEQKLDALNQYLRAYAKVLSNQSFSRVYIDAFAGTGYREQRLKPLVNYGSVFDEDLNDLIAAEPQRFLDGSPKIALRVDPRFHRYVFIEQDRQKVAELERLKLEFADKAEAIDIQEADANVAICALCGTWDSKRMRGVLFLDPFGMQIDWTTIEAVAATKCIDTWILFPFAANRLLTRFPKDIPGPWRTRLNKFFGTDIWEEKFYKKKTLVDIFSGNETIIEKHLTTEGLGAFYKSRLDVVFPVVAPNPRVLRTSSGRPLFQLFFAAANPGRGGQIALGIAKHILEKI